MSLSIHVTHNDGDETHVLDVVYEEARGVDRRNSPDRREEKNHSIRSYHSLHRYQ